MADETATVTPETTQQTEQAVSAGVSQFAKISMQIDDLIKQHKVASDRRDKILTENAKELEAPTEDVKQAIQGRESAVAQATKRVQDAKPVIPPPPSHQLHQFLAPSENDTPQNTLAKMIQGFGLLALGFGGHAKHSANASLAALGGAMKGWSTGDAIAADRHFADWKAKSETALKQWEIEHKMYRDVIADSAVSVEDKVRLLELARLQANNKAAPAIADLQSIEKMIGFLDTQQKTAATLEAWMRRVDQQKATAEQAHQDRVRAIDSRIALAKLKLASQKETPIAAEDLKMAAIMYLTKGQQPALGWDRAARAQFWSLVRQLAPEYGGAQGALATQAANAALKRELTAVAEVRGKAEAFSKTAENNLDNLLEVSKTVDRTTGHPMLDRWLLAGRKAWSGDPDVARFDFAARTAINETARVLNSATAAGLLTNEAREEIAALLNTAMTHGQIEAVVDMAKKEMAGRRRAYNDQVSLIQNQIQAANAPMTPGQTPATAPKNEPPKTEPATNFIDMELDPKTGRYVPKPK